MKITKRLLGGIALGMACMGCNNAGKVKEEPTYVKGSYGYDKAFLKAHTGHIVELMSADSSARLLLSTDYQGRVMTSSAASDTGASFGWLNYDLIAAKEKKKQFNPVGGEER